jgi:integrase
MRPTCGVTCAAHLPWYQVSTRGEWTPRELRHSFVSVLSDAGIPVEQIAQLVGHSGTTVTELVYRHQLRPVIQTGATVMDSLFAPGTGSA